MLSNVLFCWWPCIIEGSGEHTLFNPLLQVFSWCSSQDRDSVFDAASGCWLLDLETKSMDSGSYSMRKSTGTTGVVNLNSFPSELLCSVEWLFFSLFPSSSAIDWSFQMLSKRSSSVGLRRFAKKSFFGFFDGKSTWSEEELCCHMIWHGQTSKEWWDWIWQLYLYRCWD